MQLVRFRDKGYGNFTKTAAQEACRPQWPTNCANFCWQWKPPKRCSISDGFPAGELHPLKGELKGCWSLTVTGNWRLIFRYNEETNTASEIDLIDYH